MSIRTSLAGSVLAVFLLAGSASAQTSMPDTGQLGLARELLVVMKAANNVDAVLPTIMKALKPIVAGKSEKAAKDWDEVSPIVIQEMSSSKAEMLDEIAQIYARAFTMDELKQFVAFYKTPAGSKLATLVPTISQESMAVGQRWGQKAAGRIVERMKEELRKRGNDL